jgi:Xaa-Pro aminopeptidase
VPKRYWNIGIRIEDDVLVSASGHEVLTDGVPKDPDDIEAVMGRRVA